MPIIHPGIYECLFSPSRPFLNNQVHKRTEFHDADISLVLINGWQVFHEGDTWKPDQYMGFGLETVESGNKFFERVQRECRIGLHSLPQKAEMACAEDDEHTIPGF